MAGNQVPQRARPSFPGYAVLLLVIMGCCDFLARADMVGGSPENIEADADSPGVDQGRKALRKGRYPWYNATADDFHSLAPPKEREPRQAGQDFPLGTVLASALLALVIAILGLALLHAWGHWRQPGRRTRKKTDPTTIDRVEELPMPVLATGDFFRRAEASFAAGDFSRAILDLYSFQLLEMDRAGIIVLSRGKTNGRYLREVRSNRSELHPIVARTVDLFELAYFGGRALERNQIDPVWRERHRFRTLREAAR